MLPSFIVIRKIGDVAQIDYTLMANPTFTSQYMDVPLKVNSCMTLCVFFESVQLITTDHTHSVFTLSFYY